MDKVEINLAWMYPDILNLHGERGSIQAFNKIADNLGVKLKTIRINNYKEEIDLRRAEESKERAEKRLKQKENIDILRAEKSLARAIARITLAQG